MKNKGFTLIELLAVIVILAIIALIATPVVLNIIKDSKNNSTERSIELYLDQVKNEIARYNMVHPGANFNPTECAVESEGLKCDGTTDYIKIEINGITPDVGSKILLSNGKITGISNFKVSDAAYSYNNGKIEQFNPVCTAVTTATTGNVPTGSYAYGDEYTCKVGDSYTNTFFVLENNTDTVSLIMKENFVDSYVPSGVAWCTDGSIINTTCKNITAIGSNAVEGKDYLGHIKSIFNKNGVEVSFPTKDQIYIAAGNKGGALLIWLYDNLKDTTHPVYGYWTTTPTDDYSYYAWGVYYNGYFSNRDEVNNSDNYGLRPVITISKSMLG